MNSTVAVLRAEAKRLRAMAAKIDDLIAEYGDNETGPHPSDLPGLVGHTNPPRPTSEFAGLTHAEAIKKALESGPMTSRELVGFLTAKGVNLKTTTAVSSVINRMKERPNRSSEGKYFLQQAA